MDFRKILKSLGQLSEGTTDTPTGRVHKAGAGGYGRKFDTDEEGDEKKAAPAPAEKRGRGRPKKGADETGEVKKYDFSAFGMTDKPVKLGKWDKEKTIKHSLKEWVQELEEAGLSPTQTLVPGMQAGGKEGEPTIIDVKGNPALKAALDKAAQQKEITAVSIPQPTAKPAAAQPATAKPAAGSTGQAPIGQQQVAEKWDTETKVSPEEKGKYAGKTKQELLKAYNKLKASGPHKKGSPEFGRMRELAFAIRAKGDWGKVKEAAKWRKNPNAYEIGDIGNSMYGKVPATPHDEDDPLSGRTYHDVEDGKLTTAGAQKRKQYVKHGLGKHSLKGELPESVNESFTMEGAGETLNHIVKRFKHEVKSFAAGGDLDDDLYLALFDYYFDQGEMPYGIAKARSGDPMEWVTQRFDQDVHDYLDEGVVGSDVVSPQERLAPHAGAGRGPLGKVAGAVSTAAKNIGRFVQGKPEIPTLEEDPFTFESTMAKDKMMESWNTQLQSLLNEGMTVSVSKGQQGTPDSVSINATDNDAQELMALVKTAGLGLFGGDEQQTDMPNAGEITLHSVNVDDEHGHGEAPEASPEVVDGRDDMLSLIKKLTGAEGPEGTASADYEDEEEHEEHEEHEHHHDEESEEELEYDDEEEVDEGNAFTKFLATHKKGETGKIGGKTVKDTSNYDADLDEGLDEEMCHECGMMEAECGCDHEALEEGEELANGADDTFEADIKFMQDVISSGLNKQKSTGQTTVPVIAGQEDRMHESISDWKKLSGIK